MRKRRWLGLVLAPLVAALVILPATAAYANGWERAVSRWSGMCIDLHGNGEIARQWNCNGSSAQLFVRVNVGGGYVQLINQRSGQCLGVSEGATWAGALINQWDCVQGAVQQWQIFDPGGNSTGASWIVNRNSGMCIDNAWSVAQGGYLQQLDCAYAWKQFWFVG